MLYYIPLHINTTPLQIIQYMPVITIQYNTIQYNTIQYNTIQYKTIQYNTIHLEARNKDLHSPPLFCWWKGSYRLTEPYKNGGNVNPHFQASFFQHIWVPPTNRATTIYEHITKTNTRASVSIFWITFLSICWGPHILTNLANLEINEWIITN